MVSVNAYSRPTVNGKRQAYTLVNKRRVYPVEIIFLPGWEEGGKRR
jgi:hypothetical protein